MTVESVFTTSNSEVVEIHKKWLAEIDAFHDARDQIEKQFERRVYYSRPGGGPTRIMGLEPIDADYQRDAVLPEGLRLDKKGRQDMLVPMMRSARGKAIEKEWRALSVKTPTYPGMTDSVWAADDGFRSHIYWPGVFLRDDVLWCYWGTSAERVTGEVADDERRVATGFDPEIWQVRRLSEFYAMKESLEEAKSG